MASHYSPLQQNYCFQLSLMNFPLQFWVAVKLQTRLVLGLYAVLEQNYLLEGLKCLDHHAAGFDSPFQQNYCLRLPLMKFPRHFLVDGNLHTRFVAVLYTDLEQNHFQN